MSKYTLKIEVEADSLPDLWSKLSDAEIAAQNSFSEEKGYWGWVQNGWSVEIEGESAEDEVNEDESGEEE